MNGNKIIYLVSALIGLVGILLVLLLSSMSSRISTIEGEINGAFESGRLESPEQKKSRIAKEIQDFYAGSIKPDLRAMEERLMRAIENHHHNGSGGK
ncbi:MAG: hypothetical protein ACYTFZ_02935 [Planctomycetota bacterium]